MRAFQREAHCIEASDQVVVVHGGCLVDMLEVGLLEQTDGSAITISQALFRTGAVLTFSIVMDLGVGFVADLALADTIHTTSINLVPTKKPIGVQDEVRDGVEGFGRVRMTIDVFVRSCLSGLGLLFTIILSIVLSVVLLWLEGSLDYTRFADVLIASRKSTNEPDSLAICSKC